MPLEVPGVCRFTLHGNNDVQNWAVVLDIDINTDVTGDRNDAIVDQAEVINQEWAEHVQPALSAECAYRGVRWVDLDSAGGSTGETTETAGSATVPLVGSITGDAAPGNVAALVRKSVSGGRTARGGRIYVPGIAESQTDGSNLVTGQVTALQTAFNAFLTGVNQNDDPIGIGTATYDSRMVVVHELTAGGPTFSQVTGLSVQVLLATQRRRMRR